MRRSKRTKVQAPIPSEPLLSSDTESDGDAFSMEAEQDELDELDDLEDRIPPSPQQDKDSPGSASPRLDPSSLYPPSLASSDEPDSPALKPDHQFRPIVCGDNGHLYLEAFSPIADQAVDFLVAVAEPVSRPKLIHEYAMTEYSLYAAVSVGIQTDSIINVLNKLCKTELPPKLIDFIRLHTKSYGKVQLVLKDNRQFVESAFPDVLRKLLQNQVIKDARLIGPVAPANNSGEDGHVVIVDDEDGFTTHVQNYEPVSFARPVLKPARGAARPSSTPTVANNLAYSSAAPTTAPNLPPAPSTDAPEKDYIDLFDDPIQEDPFESMGDDFFDDIDTAELDNLNRLLDGQPPLTIREHNFDANDPTLDTPTSPIPETAPLPSLNNAPTDLLTLDIRAITDPSAPPTNPTDSDPHTHTLISSFEITPTHSESVRKACTSSGYPILSEYDFRSSPTLPTLDITLKPAALLRPYQEKALNKMFGNGRARSGIIVLPCGAGKTLVGVTAACTVKKRVLVLCTSSVSVEQWAREFKSWTNVREGEVAKFTSQHKEMLSNDNGILISTYTMVTFSSKRAYDAQKMMDYITSREWGLLILDEVHVVPADMFRKVLTIVSAHCKLGLTATLVREDDKIGNLNYLIGPKLYEANWLDLAERGYIANVRCSEVWCEMTKEFYKEYLPQSSRKRQLLYVMNPNKIQACQYLIDFHEQRGDKVIVFSDNVFALKHYATKLNRPYIYGGSSTADRLRTLQQFKYNPTLNTIFLSKVGDTSIDIPEASCLIQISSHYGSRRQEAQRLGRILRPKKSRVTKPGEYNSFFYTLVSRDTEEVFYSLKRQQFLVDQGYAYDIITRLEGMETVAPLVYRTLNERLELLATVLVSNDMVDLEELEDEVEEDVLAMYRGDVVGGGGSGVHVTQAAASMKSLSGADNMAYIEQTRGGLGAEFRKRGRK
ncbi:hypothetical protein HDU98_000812 [Podochytrium sp. JEL0797]|nr:hypothetical protein HDU98_000812 [Podochytrium sp. JEL0797]